MGERGSGEVRYTAFLSYSHKDAAAAGRLHRKLETYRLPRRLVGTETARGPVPERLAPIFRDREELPAATDLSETVKEALAQSGALIILCSPYSAGSLWVAEEIETFRRLHPDRPILAAVLDGDPPDCFPKALRAFGRDGTWHEPLATDLRAHRDGAHLGLLKLVAGITGVGLDALVQRDAARRIRRVTAVTALASVAVLVMAVLALLALDARRDAERQRREAEGLVEFMLTDLRSRLKGGGQIDVMAAVNARALQYYRGREKQLDGLSVASLDQRARIFLAMGQDETVLGNSDAALAAYEQAHRTTGALLARAPSDPARIFAHAQSNFYVAEIYRARRDWTKATPRYADYARAGFRLFRMAPANPDYMMEAGWGALNLGIVQLQGLGDSAAAEVSFRIAARWFDRVAELRAADQSVWGEQANGYGWIADSHLARNQTVQSLEARKNELRLRIRLHQAETSNFARLSDLARAERAVGRNESILGNRAAAAPHFQRAHELALRLTARDSRNQDWLLFKATIECDWLLREPGRPPGVTTDHLQQNVDATFARLRRSDNPNRRDIEPCTRSSGAARARNR